MPSLLFKLLYKYLGPTTIHLQHEFILLAILSIFTSASFYTTYHSHKSLLSSPPVKIGSDNCLECYQNELIYIMMSTLWLGRHLLHRIICTTEVNTTIYNSSTINVCPQNHPVWLSTLYRIWIWISCGGQYFGIPSCPVQLALHDPSSSVAMTTSRMNNRTNTRLNSTTNANNSNNSNSNNNNSSGNNRRNSNSNNHKTNNKHTNQFLNLNSTIRNIIQTTNVKTSAVGVVDHHRHHQSNHKSNTDSMLYRKTPPLHRTYIIQVFVIVPMIVVPVAISKYIMSKLRSRKRTTRGYYDSDDDDEDMNNNSNNHSNNNTNNTDRRRRRNNDHNHNDSTGDDKYTSTSTRNNDYNFSFNDDNDNDNDVYIKIHFKTQKQVNTHLDSLWKYTPSAQFMIWFVVISLTLYCGTHFYSLNDVSTVSGSGNGNGSRFFKSDGGAGLGYWKYNNPAMNGVAGGGGYQQYSQNRFPGGSALHGHGHSHGFGHAGAQSTVLNAELMAQKFKMKQKQTNVGSGGRTSFYHYGIGMKGFYNLIYGIADNLGVSSWKSSFYSPWGMIYMISFWGIITSLSLFGRIMLPLPDLIAGGRDSWNGRANGKSHKQKRKEKSWAESYMPITTGNKFNLYFKIIFVRIIENLIICAILPQSLYICKATGHCNVEPTIFEIGNPTAIQRGYGLHGSRGMFDNLIQDRLAGFIIALSVIVTSTMMLLGQVVVLDKSALSFEAHNYIQGNGTNSMKSSDGHNHKRGGGRRTNSGNGNDALHLWNDNGGSGGNTPNSDKKKSMLSSMREFVYKTFSLELGALSTSRILSFIFCVYAVQAILVVILAIVYSSTGKDWYPLVLTLIAVFTAAGGSDVDTADFDELEGIANEINAAYAMEKSESS